MSSKSKGKYLSNIVGLLCNWSAEELTMFLLLRSLMHEYTIMKWLAGLPPLFASSSPLTWLFHPCLLFQFSTRGCFFTFPSADDFFCFFTRGCFFAFLLCPPPVLPPSVPLCLHHQVGLTEKSRIPIVVEPQRFFCASPKGHQLVTKSKISVAVIWSEKNRLWSRSIGH